MSQLCFALISLTLDDLKSTTGVGANLALEWWNSGYRSLEDVYENASLSPTIKLGIELFEEFEQRHVK